MIRDLIRFALIIAAFVMAVACQQASPKAQEFKKYATEADVPRVSPADAKKAFDDGSAVIIDARSEESYKGDHIKGAINIPFGQQDKMMDKVPKGKKLIIYCS
ncbi:MAG: rhodanese-like domain-containing protein [Acidobacteriota bacterium]